MGKTRSVNGVVGGNGTQITSPLSLAIVQNRWSVGQWGHLRLGRGAAKREKRDRPLICFVLEECLRERLDGPTGETPILSGAPAFPSGRRCDWLGQTLTKLKPQFFHCHLASLRS